MRGVYPPHNAANTWRDLLYPLPSDEARTLNFRKVALSASSVEVSENPVFDPIGTNRSAVVSV
jgi:hypothetical protein